MPKLKKGPPQKGPTKGSKVWTAEGAEHIYRAPYHDAKRKTWRVRRRNRFTNAVNSLTLVAESEGEARRQVQELAFSERTQAEEEKKNPEIVRPEKITVEDALLGRKVVQD